MRCCIHGVFRTIYNPGVWNLRSSVALCVSILFSTTLSLPTKLKVSELHFDANFRSFPCKDLMRTLVCQKNFGTKCEDPFCQEVIGILKNISCEGLYRNLETFWFRALF